MQTLIKLSCVGICFMFIIAWNFDKVIMEVCH